EADEIGAERRQCRGQRVFVGEVELAEDQAGGGAIEEEVVPLDRGADGRRDDGLAQVGAVVVRAQRRVGGCRCHWGFLRLSSPRGGFRVRPLCYIQELGGAG